MLFNALQRSSTTRLFSTSPPKMNLDGARETLNMARQAKAWVMQHSSILLVMAGASLVMYGFYRVSIRTMKFFINVTDKQIFNGGFVLGLLAAAAVAGTGIFAYRFSTFHVDDVYRVALRELRKYEAVSTALGGAWLPGKFRGYAIESMTDAMKGSERRSRSSFFEAPSRRIQMVFQVRGAARDGLVSLEAFKRGGKYHFEMLALDVRGTQEHIFLAGDEDHALFPEVLEALESARESQRQKYARSPRTGGSQMGGSSPW